MTVKNEKIYIFGHKNPDTDSVASSIALSYLQNILGFETEPKILGSLNKETMYILNKFNIQIPKILDKISSIQKVILVDHNELSQSVDNLREEQVIGIIDHHKIGILMSSPVSVLIRPVGSTCTIISKLYKYYNIKIPVTICNLLLCGIISDTLLFKSPTCTDSDIEESKKLQEQLQLKYEDIVSLGIEIFEAGSSISQMTTEELINSDFKEIKINSQVVGISQLSLLNVSPILKTKNDLILLLKKKRDVNNYYLCLLLVTDILNEGSYIFYDCSDKKLIDLLFGCYCEQGKFICGLVSRKKQILPQLSQLLK